MNEQRFLFWTKLHAQFEENWRKSRELEEKILAMPGTRAVYLHLRWHSTHPGMECPICGRIGNGV